MKLPGMAPAKGKRVTPRAGKLNVTILPENDSI